MMTCKFACTVLILSTLVSGCVSLRSYPDEWPKKSVSESACIDISGKYKPVSRRIPPPEVPCERGYGLQMSFGGQSSCVSLPMMFGTVFGEVTKNSWMKVVQTPHDLTVSYHVPKDDLQEQMKKKTYSTKWSGRITESGDGVLERVLIAGKDYKCGKSGIDLVLSSNWQNANIGAAKTERFRTFLKAEDGSLVLDSSDLEYGFFWLPPFALVVYGNRWALWPHYNK